MDFKNIWGDVENQKAHITNTLFEDLAKEMVEHGHRRTKLLQCQWKLNSLKN